MLAEFWAATIGFFCTFFSCFAPGSLGVYYKDSSSNLDLGDNPKLTLSNAGAYAVTGTIVMRVLAGPMCDVLGARKTFAVLLVIGIPGMLIFAMCTTGWTFTLGRIVIGLSLATFVTCQVGGASPRTRRLREPARQSGRSPWPRVLGLFGSLVSL